MKITCDSCQAKYTIADEKVVGKIVKIKCKKCGTTIVVDGNAAAQQHASVPPQAATVAQQQGGDEDEGETRVFGNGPASAPNPDEWTVNVTDDDQRTMTAQEIAAEYARGTINADTYVWRDGMPDWLPLSEVPELMRLVSESPTTALPSPVASSAPTPIAGGGLGGTVLMTDDAAARAPSPFAPRPAAAAAPAASPSAARRAGGRAGSVDLFGAAAAEREAPPPSSPPPAMGNERQIGERNENSVLFSLAALTAAENAARAQSKADEAVLDLRPGPSRNNGRAGLDDIMNLGGGGIGGGMAPMLAPPPLLAPVVEPPPPPQPVSVAPAAMPASGPMLGAQPGAGKKVPVGLIVGVALGLAAIAGVAVFALGGSGEQPVAQNQVSPEQTSAPVTQAVASPTETAQPPTPAETAAPNATPSDTAAAAEPSTKPTAAPGKEPAAVAKKDEPKKEEPKKEEPKKEEPKKEEPKAEGPKGEFNRGAASAALGNAAGAARACKKPDGPTGTGRVRVTFAPSGNVTSSTIESGPFAGTAVGGCIASAFRTAKVPPFDGSPVTVTKSFSIN